MRRTSARAATFESRESHSILILEFALLKLHLSTSQAKQMPFFCSWDGLDTRGGAECLSALLLKLRGPVEYMENKWSTFEFYAVEVPSTPGA